MKLLEAPICAKAVARLRSKGWRVGCEIRADNRPIDAAAILNGKVLGLEAKISLNKKLRHQLKRLTIRADYVLGVVGSPPRKEGINWCVKHRIGLWIVTDGPIIELITYRQLTPNNNYRNDMIRRLERWDETIVGGVPNRLGIGVAQDVQRRVDGYRAANPGATWKEIYSNVPSHYDSYKNMYSSLRSNAERLAWRKRVPGSHQENLWDASASPDHTATKLKPLRINSAPTAQKKGSIVPADK
jgi:hypothetical protein